LLCFCCLLLPFLDRSFLLDLCVCRAGHIDLPPACVGRRSCRHCHTIDETPALPQLPLLPLSSKSTQVIRLPTFLEDLQSQLSKKRKKKPAHFAEFRHGRTGCLHGDREVQELHQNVMGQLSLDDTLRDL
jgi:hypothetical protein